MRTTRVLGILILFNFCALLGWAIFEHYTRPRIGYVDIQEVYTHFELKKELEAKLKSTQQVQKNILDSLALGLKALDKQLDKAVSQKVSQKFESQKEDFIYRQTLFQNQASTLTEQYTGQIWSQLNQYIRDFGKEKGYTFIIGGNGSGNVMHADEGYNITSKVIDYVNARYKDKK